MKEKLRYFLKDSIRKEVDFSRTPQNLGHRPPPLEKPLREGEEILFLPLSGAWPVDADLSLVDAIGQRRSHRSFTSQPLLLAELAFLLWAVQGVRNSDDVSYRTVPSAGCRHPFETYLAVFHVEGLERGLYRYLPLEHGLVRLEAPKNLEAEAIRAAMRQPFAGKGSVTFIWTALPERTEWRYAEASVKVIALDAGHVCQNLYLACQAVGAGTCAIAAYDQEAADRLVGVDGIDEFVVYMAPLGKVNPSAPPSGTRGAD